MNSKTEFRFTDSPYLELARNIVADGIIDAVIPDDNGEFNNTFIDSVWYKYLCDNIGWGASQLRHCCELKQKQGGLTKSEREKIVGVNHILRCRHGGNFSASGKR